MTASLNFTRLQVTQPSICFITVFLIKSALKVMLKCVSAVLLAVQKNTPFSLQKPLSLIMLN